MSEDTNHMIIVVNQIFWKAEYKAENSAFRSQPVTTQKPVVFGSHRIVLLWPILVNVVFSTWNQVGIYLLVLLQDKTPEKYELGYRVAEFEESSRSCFLGSVSEIPKSLWSTVSLFINLDSLVNSLISLLTRTLTLLYHLCCITSNCNK